MDKLLKDKITIDFYSILRDLKRNFWVVVLAALIGIMSSFVVQHNMYVPEYTSKATLVINSKIGNSSTSTSMSASNQIAGVFAKIIVQPSMKNKTAEFLEESFDAAISAKVLSNTNILEVSVTAKSPDKAYRYLNAVLKVYPEISDSIFTNAVIEILKMPYMPKSPSNYMPESNKLIIAAGITAAVLAVIVFLSIMRDTIKNEEAFEDKIDSKLIGTIPHEKKRISLKDRLAKKRKALLINESIFVSLKFSESFHKISTKIEYMNHRHGSKVFAITSVAENEGKSTVASNIAISLANRGNRVLLLDLDTKKPALYKIFEAEPKENAEFGDLVSGKIKASDYEFRRYKKTRLFLAINTKSHKGHERFIENGTVFKILDYLKNKVDFVIIDTAPLSVDSGVTSLVKYADKTLMVVRNDVVHTAAINDAVLTIKDVGGEFGGCILNDVYPKFSFFGQTGFDEGGYYNRYYGRYSGYGRYGRYNKYSKYKNYMIMSNDEESQIQDDLLVLSDEMGWSNES